MKRAKTPPPQWATDIVNVESGGHHIKIHWYRMREGYLGHGRAHPQGWMKCFADDNKTNASLCLVLHELTHVLTDRPDNTQRLAWHGPAFQKKVIQLYEKYGVLDFAEHWERYKRIKRAIAQYKAVKQNPPQAIRIIKKINIKATFDFTDETPM